MNKYLHASVITVTAFVLIIGSVSIQQQLYEQPTANALIDPEPDFRTRAPIAISGDNVYIVWTTDKNMPNNNSEVMFRASTDSGATFGDKINLSNTTTADSLNAEIAATDGDEVIVTWWEKNQTSDEPVFRASVDNGLTFGPLIPLSTNGTLAQQELEEAIDD
jgi:hypothetical protein